jgi:integrative and conjugative element protein (TIGR02256 family)
MSTATRHFFGLRYPTRHGGITWLMLVMGRGKRKVVGTIPDERAKRDAFEKSPVVGLRVHSARPSDLHLRNTGVVAQSIRDKRLAMIGLGALGSEVTELLAKAGVQSFRLYDMDRLSTGNVARHVGGLNEFGAPKVRVVATRINEINPYVRFPDGDIIFGSAVASLEELAEFIRPADLIISTVADESVESVINQVAALERKPVLYGRALRRASMGRVFLVRPGRDACKACLAMYARQGREGGTTPADWIDVPESEADAIVHECGRPVIPASAVDLAFIAGLVARVALNYLEEPDAGGNHWIWTKFPAPEVDARLTQPLGTFTGHLEPDPACPACQEPDVRGIKLSESARRDIVNITEASPDAETGGVLIGYVDSERWAHVIRATGPGPNAERSAYRFSRDVAFVQAELERAARELGERGIYVGEWHSHLVAEPRPSTTDIDSLLGIASAQDYLTRCPVMVIAGLAPDSKKVESIRAWSFPVGGRVYDCAIDSRSY